MNNNLNLKRTTFAVSMICNLNCKLCAAYSPYMSKKSFPSLEKWLEYMRTYFSIIDNVEVISISGGEPLLYKQLPELLKNLLIYSAQFKKLEIITNGTTVPSKELLDVVKEYEYNVKFDKFLIDNYGTELSKKVPEIISVLEAYNIPYEARDYNTNLHCGGWVDFDITENPKHKTKEACEALYAKCAYPQKLKFCFSIRPDGKIIPCPPIQYRLMSGQKVDYNDYIDLTDDNLSIDEQRKKIINIYTAKCLETCAYCNGMCDDSPRFKPAEQLTPEEISEIRRKNGQS